MAAGANAEDPLVGRGQSPRSTSAPVLRAGEQAGLQTRSRPGAMSSGAGRRRSSARSLEPASCVGGAGLGDRDAVASASTQRGRETSRYWTIAALSALVALVVAGVTSGTGQHGVLHHLAQGQQGPVRTHSGSHTPGTGSTGPTAPGSRTGDAASGAVSSGTPSGGPHGAAAASSGRVTLIGASSTTGTAAPPPTAPPAGSAGGAGGPAPPQVGRGPATPMPVGAGSTVSPVGSTVTTVAAQLGSAVPPVAPATSAVNGAVGTVDQAVSTTPL